jgi:hypothetical protein
MGLKYGVLVLLLALGCASIENNRAEEFCSGLSNPGDDDSYIACLKRYDIETEYLRQRK